MVSQLRRPQLGTCNARSLYRADSLKIVETELVEYKLDLGAVQEVK